MIKNMCVIAIVVSCFSNFLYANDIGEFAKYEDEINKCYDLDYVYDSAEHFMRARLPKENAYGMSKQYLEDVRNKQNVEPIVEEVYGPSFTYSRYFPRCIDKIVNLTEQQNLLVNDCQNTSKQFEDYIGLIKSGFVKNTDQEDWESAGEWYRNFYVKAKQSKTPFRLYFNECLKGRLPQKASTGFSKIKK